MKRINHLRTSIEEEEIIQQGMFYCPYGRTNYQCFFLWLQKRTLKEKMEWYRKLTPNDKRELVQCHRGCTEGQPMRINKTNNDRLN
ncbi:MAG: hypothetical protein N2662_11085 [Bacteroidales bacterium]|nr:hypothetical protein [Bacteroidales bacterium]